MKFSICLNRRVFVMLTISCESSIFSENKNIRRPSAVFVKGAKGFFKVHVYDKHINTTTTLSDALCHVSWIFPHLWMTLDGSISCHPVNLCSGTIHFT